MRNLLLLFVALCGICCWPQAGRAAMALDSRFTTESDHLSFKRDDGVSLTGKDLVGQSLMLGKPGNPIEIRIDGLDEHVDDTGRRTPLYRISARRHPDTAFGRLCDPDASGRDAALTLIDEAGHVKSYLHERRRRQMHPVGLSPLGIGRGDIASRHSCGLHPDDPGGLWWRRHVPHQGRNADRLSGQSRH